MCGCADVRMCRGVDVQMSGFADVRMRENQLLMENVREISRYIVDDL
jgi:hypothetical protein